MEKMIVTTDFSGNSKAGIRFAINLAQVKKVQLIFLHIYQLLPASFWTDEEYEHFKKRYKDIYTKELAAFVKNIYRGMKIVPRNYELAVLHSLDTVDEIMKYSKQQEASCICIGNRGGGRLQKLFGTTVTKLIARSETPVLCVPPAYRVRPVKHVLYASDMTDYEYETGRVVDFIRPLKATLEMLHLSYPYEFIPDYDLMGKALQQKNRYKITLHYEKRDIEYSLREELAKAIERTKTSLLVLFTRQDRSVFERIFLSGTTKAYVLHATVPMLCFKKQ